MTLDLSNGFLEMILKAEVTKGKKGNCHQENLKLFCFKETQLKKKKKGYQQQKPQQ